MRLNKTEQKNETRLVSLAENELTRKRRIARNNFYKLSRQIEHLETRKIKLNDYDKNFFLVKKLLENSERYMLETRLNIKMEPSSNMSVHFYEEINDLATMPDIDKLKESHLPKNIFNCFL